MPYKDRSIQNDYLRLYMRKRYKEIRRLIDFYSKYILPYRQQIELIIGTQIPEIKVRRRK